MNECTNRSCISLATLGGKCNAFFFFSLIYFWILSCCFQADTPPLCRSAQGHRFYVFIWTLCTKRSCSRLFLLICKRFLRGMLGGPCLSHADSYFFFFFLIFPQGRRCVFLFQVGKPSVLVDFWMRNYTASETYQLSWRRGGRTLLKHWIETLKLWHSIKKVTASKSSQCSSVQLGLISFFDFIFYFLLPV